VFAEPGEIWVSRVVRDQVRDKLKFAFEDMGERVAKNIARPIRTYRVRYDGAHLPAPIEAERSPVCIAEAPEERGNGRWRYWTAGTAVILVATGLGAWSAMESGLPSFADSVATPQASVAVLPFANLSGEPDQDYFSEGVTEDVLTELARFPNMFVPASNSTRRYDGPTVDLETVGRELGVRYALRDSVRRSADQVRVTAQLIEIASGAQVWAERYDRPLTKIFAV
jgi:adenylate cyclase